MCVVFGIALGIVNLYKAHTTNRSGDPEFVEVTLVNATSNSLQNTLDHCVIEVFCSHVEKIDEL